MKKGVEIFKILNIEEKEIAPALFLIIQSVFLGVFYGSFDIGAHTIFLKTFPEDAIPKAYVLSGLLGIGLTTLYSRLQQRMPFARLVNYTFLTILVTVIVSRLLFEFSDSKWVVFYLFILLGPLNIMALLAFWGTVTRIFNLRQGKRLFGIIDAGQIVGIIISSYSIPLIIDRIGGTNNLLVISVISIVFALLISIVISRRFSYEVLEEDEKEEQPFEQESVKIKSFYSNAYLRYMSLFVGLSMLAAFFIQYSFLVVTNEQYPGEDELAKFLGFFTGTMMVFTLAIKTLVYGKLLKIYGLKVSLILSSTVLALIVMFAIVAGYIGGYNVASGGFIYFFLLISLGKLLNKTLKDSLEGPAFKILYQSLDKKFRFDIQAKVDGTINEISALVSGLLLTLLGVLTFVKLIHFSIVLFALLCFWAWVTFKLYKEYRKSLEMNLQSDLEEEKVSEIEHALSRIPRDKLYTEKLMNKLNLIYCFAPLKFTSTLKNILGKETPNNNAEGYSKIFLSEIFLLKIRNELPKTWEDWIDGFIKEKSSSEISVYGLAEGLKSNDPTLYLSALNSLWKQNQRTRLSLFSGLMRDPDSSVQQLVIRLSGSVEELEVIGGVVDLMPDKKLFASCLLSLSRLASKGHASIVQQFYRSEIPVNTQLALIKVLGSLSNKKVKRFLLDQVSNQRYILKNQATKVLLGSGFQASEKERLGLFQTIKNQAEVMAWDIVALATIGSDKTNESLFEAMNLELEKHKSLMMDILAICYNAKSVANVTKHLESGTNEGISYGLELFDIFLSDEIKSTVLSVFEDLPILEKAKLLQNRFAVELMSEKELLLAILNRNPNLISNYTKRVALSYYQQYFSEVSNDLIAQLFSPVESLQKKALSVVNSIDANRVEKIKNRLPKELLLTYNLNREKMEFDSNRETGTVADWYSPVKHLFRLDAVDVFTRCEFKYYESANLQNNGSPVDNYFVFLVIGKESEESNKQQKVACFSRLNKEHQLVEEGRPVGIVGFVNDEEPALIVLDDLFMENVINLIQ